MKEQVTALHADVKKLRGETVNAYATLQRVLKDAQLKLPPPATAAGSVTSVGGSGVGVTQPPPLHTSSPSTPSGTVQTVLELLEKADKDELSYKARTVAAAAASLAIKKQVRAAAAEHAHSE